MRQITGHWREVTYVNIIVLVVFLFPALSVLGLLEIRETKITRWQELERLPEAQLVYPGCVVTNRSHENAHREWTDRYPTMVGYSCLSTDDTRQLRLWYHNELLKRGWSHSRAFGGWDKGEYHLSMFSTAADTNRSDIHWEQLPGQHYRYEIRLSIKEGR